ncbi:putative disease resistance protein At3g14460 isoform X1 [Arachis ipaensis]|uniref:putative disease resistance protein At3g14460 isoform X1 n=1 Tax=Arachis ipaensis TaxID=130454 RepID=UPI0007AF540C|nr:putative disease resistance protein At3g14460 isoform X1 [Arachis ipaensis]
MAAKLVGGAYLSSFVDAVLNKLSDVKSTPIATKLADQKFLRRLRACLRAVRPVLDDAEQKQIRDQEVNKWLVDLQDALYLADDLLDELSTKAATATPTQSDPGNSSYHYHYAVDSVVEYSDGDEIRIVESMQDIVDKLESIVEEKDDLGLKQELVEDPKDMSWRIQSSLVESSDIYGRNDDKEAIIKLLLDDTCDDKLSVISIEGIGGIGKTTLAQLVYNDARVKEKFAIKAWVCVATRFDPISVSKAIIEEITSLCNMVNLNSLQTQLKEKLTQKTFLVVLDDVWDNQQNLWDNFLKPFLSGNKGSKILLTTRNKNVDSVVSNTNLHYKLDILSPNDCWSLFLKHSSLSTNSRQYVILEKIGKKIVEKCKGLPLALKTLGGLLCKKKNEEYWETTLKSEIWELPEDKSEIVPALRVSYHYLPSHLKRCFVYCSLYPEDYQFDKDELILLWMAEDLVQPIENYTLENIGCAYFDELVARSFFQSSSKNVSLFVMHDLMHDLATFFAGKFYFSVREFGDRQKICSKTRHLSYMVNPRDPILRLEEAYKGAIHMRTFLDVHFSHQPYGSIKLESDFWLFQLHMRCLRVLSFKSFSIESLPDSIGELIHLHYLDLSYTPILTLPESLCKVYNLQTLKLRYCDKLAMLPSRIQELVNLRHLDIRGTYCLKEMSKGMSKLKHLNLLSDYIVGKHEENGIRELGALDNLHGSLSISKLENVNNSREALEAKMGKKKHVIILDLKWRREGDIVDVETARDILEELQPHRNLKELSIDGYRGGIFPDWLGLSSYSNVTILTLNRCKNCRQVPSLGQLPSLQYLEILGLEGLERIGGEFYNNAESSHQGTPFRSLLSLRFDKMHRWREWHIPDEIDVFPKLENLSIRDCPVLSGDLPAHLPVLEQLSIVGCEKLACSLPRAPKLHQLTVKGSGFYRNAAPHEVLIKETQLAKSALECLSHIQSPCFQDLEIHECRSAISISGDYLPDSLQFLRIWDCSKLTFSEPLQHKSLTQIDVTRCGSLTLLPLGALPNLKKLSISKCLHLVSVPELGFAAPHLEELYMRDCPEMDCFGKECLPPSLTTLWINNCEKLERWITSKGLQSEGLTHLMLHKWNEVKSFPREGCLPSSLQSLQLWSFSNLETLDCKGLHQLSFLQKLTIEYCRKLENITQENLPSSISELLIRGECPLRSKLEEMNDPRIQFDTGTIYC